MKKILFVSLLFLFLVLPVFALAQEVEIIFFYSPTCPYCAKEEKFLDNLQKEYPDLVINRYSVTSPGNLSKLEDFYNKFEVAKQYQGLVPATFTNSRYFIGFDLKIEEDIRTCLKEVCYKNNVSEKEFTVIDTEGNIDVPFIGKLNIKNYSLLGLSVILGILDGFNVCSLGALVLILGLVLALRSRKKVLIFGGLFILTTAVVYGILIVAWYNIFTLFVPHMSLMQILIGLLGIGGGIYFFKEFLKFKKQGPACEISATKGLIAKFSTRFKENIQNSKNIIILLGSILFFAAIITIVEFPCSAVVPMAFAGVLAQSNLSAFYYLFYISVFVLFYMLDEIIVFLVALFAMKIWLASSRAIIWITLVESIILFALGAYYLLNTLL